MTMIYLRIDLECLSCCEVVWKGVVCRRRNVVVPSGALAWVYEMAGLAHPCTAEASSHAVGKQTHNELFDLSKKNKMNSFTL